MKKAILAAAVSGFALAAAPAAAQTVSEAPAGGRVEAVVGYDRPSVDVTGDDFKAKGLVYGVGGGYDVPLGQKVSVGADLEATGSTAKKSAGGAEVKSGRDLYAGGRVSFAMNPVANIYLKGGYTNARFKAEDAVVSDSVNLDGYRIGAGGQFRIGGNSGVYVGPEYRYSNYENGVERHQIVATVGTRF